MNSLADEIDELTNSDLDAQDVNHKRLSSDTKIPTKKLKKPRINYDEVRNKYPKSPILSNGKSDENSKDGHDTQKDYSTALKERNVDENESRRITFENKNILRKKDGNTNKGDVNWSSSPLQTSHNEHPKPPNPPKSKCHEKDEDENQRTPSSNDENQALLNGKNENVTPKYEGDSRLANAFARTPHAAAWISKHMSGDKERFLKVLSGERNRQGLALAVQLKYDKVNDLSSTSTWESTKQLLEL